MKSGPFLKSVLTLVLISIFVFVLYSYNFMISPATYGFILFTWIAVLPVSSNVFSYFNELFPTYVIICFLFVYNQLWILMFSFMHLLFLYCLCLSISMPW